ncbi:hypothetical protein J19TS1_28700 [Heyndrickxia oleronia]|jgi:hypothetical protein|nr:hypothetical protein J19TS1_28700 [Heyndrickxia oleronia]
MFEKRAYKIGTIVELLFSWKITSGEKVGMLHSGKIKTLVISYQLLSKEIKHRECLLPFIWKKNRKILGYMDESVKL